VSEAIKPALAIEMFHNFTLVHDDIMDHSEMRRGSLTVHKKWNEATAILSGDVMLVLAYELLGEVKADRIKAVLQLFNESSKKVCEGQQLDMIFENTADVTVDDYIEMIGKKTGALFACSLKMGAIIAGSSAEDAEHMYQFGYNAGISFQVQDDILDTFGQSGQTGKKIGGDIASNKKTFLAIKALEKAGENDLEQLISLSKDNNVSPENKINQTISVFNKLEIKKEAEAVREKYFDLAMNNLDNVNASAEGKIFLRNIAESLINREN